MSLIQEFQDARHDKTCAVLEGFHAVKHAMRFGAQITRIVTSDKHALSALARALAPDVVDRYSQSEEIPTYEFNLLATPPVASHVIALAKRIPYTMEAIGAWDNRIVLLDNPTHLGNVGAVIRVAAARGIAGVVLVGDIDPWHPHVVRGAAGLQFAIPVLQLEDAGTLQMHNRPLIAFHEVGTPLHTNSIPHDAVLAFGSERHGLSARVKDRAHMTVMIPMQRGVSSLNLATSVAIALYTS